ncbi:MAG TPA: hypothetical protein VLH75_01200 [Longimicrobiales bacterium]|nr:hypothetical protein [Longimicrobiales bacterium]
MSTAVVAAALALAAQDTARAPLPAEPPIGGPGWTVVVPAILFLVTAAGTWALWRRFADMDDEEE